MKRGSVLPWLFMGRREKDYNKTDFAGSPQASQGKVWKTPGFSCHCPWPSAPPSARSRTTSDPQKRLRGQLRNQVLSGQDTPLCGNAHGQLPPWSLQAATPRCEPSLTRWHSRCSFSPQVPHQPWAPRPLFSLASQETHPKQKLKGSVSSHG